MADPVLKFPPEQKITRRALRPKVAEAAAPPVDGRPATLSPHAVAGGVAAGGADRRVRVLSQWRPLCDDRRRLCRRPEGSDHARHLRQDRKGRGPRRPAVKQGDVLFEIDPIPFRLAVAAGQGHARPGPHHLQQSEGQHQDLRQDGRPDAAGRRPEAARCRPQVDAGQEQVRLAARPRQFLDRARHRAGEMAFVQQQLSSAKTQLLGNADLPLEEFPPYRRPRRRSARPSATSITP